MSEGGGQQILLSVIKREKDSRRVWDLKGGAALVLFSLLKH
jgi:hypothetical protein